MSEPGRYVLAESSGYPMAEHRGVLISGRWTTEYMVLDTAYCYRVVWSSLRNPHDVTKGARPQRRSLAGREAAEEVCRRFNESGSRLPLFNNFGRPQ